MMASSKMHARAKAAWEELKIDAYSPSPSQAKSRTTSTARIAAGSAQQMAGSRRRTPKQAVAADLDPAFIDARLVVSAVQQRLSTPGPAARLSSDRKTATPSSKHNSQSVDNQARQTPSQKFRSEFEDAMQRVKAMQSAMSVPAMPRLDGSSAEFDPPSPQAELHSFSEEGMGKLLQERLSIPSPYPAVSPPLFSGSSARVPSTSPAPFSGKVAAEARAAARQNSRLRAKTPSKKLKFQPNDITFEDPPDTVVSKRGTGTSGALSESPQKNFSAHSPFHLGRQLADLRPEAQHNKKRSVSAGPRRNTKHSSPPILEQRSMGTTSRPTAAAAGGGTPLGGNAPGTASEMRHLREESAAALTRAARAERLLKEAVGELNAWRVDRSALVEGKRIAEERAAVLQSNVDELRGKVRAARARRAADAQALADVKGELRALRGDVHDRDAQLTDAHAVMEVAQQENSILQAQLQASEEARAAAEGEVEVARVQLARLRGALGALQARSSPPSPEPKPTQADGSGDVSLVAQLLSRLSALEAKQGGSNRQRGDSAGSRSSGSSSSEGVPVKHITSVAPHDTVRMDDFLT